MQLTGGGLSANTSEGVGGSATFMQSGGSNVISNTLGLGGGADRANLTGSGQLSASYEYVGSSNGGTGIFTQSGGTNGSGELYLAYDGGSGSYSLSGSGQLSASVEYLGHSGPGIFTQSGGINNLGYATLYLGYSNSGTYNLSGSGQLSAGYEYLGYNGTGMGIFTQSGGTNAIGDSLYFGYNPGSGGTYNLSGSGQLSAPNEYIGYNHGTGTLTQSGGTNTIGTLFLATGMGQSGTYNLNGGLLVLAEFHDSSGAAVFNFNGGTLQAGSAVLSIYVPMTLGTSGGGATFDTAGYSVNVFNLLSGPGGLTKVDSGTLVLAASNSYTGTTTIDAGVLSLSSSAALAGGGNITFGGGTLQYTYNNAQDYSGKIVGSTMPISIDTNGVNVTFRSNLVSSNTGGLNKIGSGSVTLEVANTFSGNTLIAGGTLVLASSLALQNSTLDTSGSGTLSFGSLTAATLGGLTGPGTLNLANSSSVGVAVQAGNNGASTTFSGALTGSGSLTKVGSGTLLLSGSNTYSGTTTVNAGTLEAAGTASLPDTGLAGKITVANSGTLAVSTGGNGWTAAGISTLLSSNGTGFASGSILGVDTSGGSLSYTLNIAGSMGLTKLGGNTLLLTGTNTYSGGTAVDAGTLQAAGTAALPGYGTAGKITVGNGGTLAVSAERQRLDGH